MHYGLFLKAPVNKLVCSMTRTNDKRIKWAGTKGLIQNHMWHIRRAIFMEKHLYLCFGTVILYEWASLQPREPRHFAQSRNYVPL